LSGDTTAMTPAEEGGLPPASTPVERALRALEPPRHASGFWTRLDERLADEPQLRLTPRSAIRPITQPPPVVDDSSLASTLKGGLPPPRRTHRRTVVAVVAVLLLALLVVAALQEPDDDAATSDTTTTVAGDAQGGEPASPEETTIPTTTLPPGAIDPAEPLTPAGVSVSRGACVQLVRDGGMRSPGRRAVVPRGDDDPHDDAPAGGDRPGRAAHPGGRRPAADRRDLRRAAGRRRPAPGRPGHVRG